MGWAKETGALGLKEGEVPGKKRKRILGISENRLHTLQSLQGNRGRESTPRGHEKTEHWDFNPWHRKLFNEFLVKPGAWICVWKDGPQLQYILAMGASYVNESFCRAPLSCVPTHHYSYPTCYPGTWTFRFIVLREMMRCAVGESLGTEENPELRGYRGPKI